MKKWLIFFIGLFLFAQEYVGDFEELGASATGIGQAMVAFKKDGSSFYYNPSLSVLSNKKEIYFYHSENFGGQFRNEYLSFTYPKENIAFGVSIYANLIPNIPYCSLPNPNLPPNDSTNKPIFVRNIFAYDLINYYNLSFLLNFITIGFNLKFIYRNLGIHQGFGAGSDLGITLIPYADLLLGLRVKNIINSPIIWSDKKKERLMPNIAIGISKSFNNLVLAYENELTFNKLPNYNNFGLEYKIKDLVFLRIGFYRRCFTFGFGIAYRSLYFDYGYESKKFPESDLPSSLIKLSGGIKF